MSESKNYNKKCRKFKVYVCGLILCSFVYLPVLAQFNILFQPKESEI